MKTFTAAAIRVVVVVPPTEAEFLLSLVLHPRGMVAGHPIVALGGKEKAARPQGIQVSGGGF